MLISKVNELSRNAVILIAVLIFSITLIVITLLVVGEGGTKSSAYHLKSFQKAFIDEYGVKPNIDIMVHRVSEAQAESITESMSKGLNLQEPVMQEGDNYNWYETEDEKGDVSFSAFYD